MNIQRSPQVVLVLKAELYHKQCALPSMVQQKQKEKVRSLSAHVLERNQTNYAPQKKKHGRRWSLKSALLATALQENNLSI